MTEFRHRRVQQAAARKHALPLGTPTAGGPLIKSTPNLGWMLEKRAASFTIDYELAQSESVKRDAENKGMAQFIAEENRLDGAKFQQQYPFTATWYPAIDYHEPDVQVGDRGGRRPIARSVAQDSQNSGKMACRLEAVFLVPEYINEIPTSLANEIGLWEGKRKGLRPLRERR